MGSDFQELGNVRFLPEEPELGARSLGFAAAALGDRRVQEALSGHRWRLLHVEPLVDKGDEDRVLPQAYEAVYYDYSRNQAVRARGADGPLDVRLSHDQPLPSLEEFQRAVELVSQSRVWGPLLQAGHVQAYDPMPPVLQPENDYRTVERTLFVGLASKERRFNRIVAVNMVREEVSSQAVTPSRAVVIQRTCGVSSVSCSSRPGRGTSGSTVIQWPAANPVWQFKAIRPTASSGRNASGVELRDVFYRGKRVLSQAHMPILNVQYDRDRCGPYRDWLYEETCFEARGTDITKGFRMCSSPPSTIFESGRDGGNYTGVAVYETPAGHLGVLSVCRAGWYRYVMEWRFALDGRIFPKFRFAGVSNSCVCNTHHHHALWRLDFDVIDHVNVVEELTGSTWKTLTRETSRRRQANLAPLWRVRHPATGAGYQITPGPTDGRGNTYSGDDLYLLRHRSSEVDDGRSESARNTSTNLGKFLGNESLAGQDIVVWYAAHFRHAVGEGDHGEQEVGPVLEPFGWPA